MRELAEMIFWLFRANEELPYDPKDIVDKNVRNERIYKREDNVAG